MSLGKNKGIGLFICFAAVLLLLSCAVYAGEPIDVDKSASLMLSFKPDGKIGADLEFSLYKAASVSADCSFTFSDKFKDYPLSLDIADTNGWRVLAQTMAAYVAADNIPCDLTAETGSDGTVCFPNLETGLYLVIGSGFDEGDDTYTPTPFLVSLPGYGNREVWQYDRVAEVKYETVHHGSDGGDEDDEDNKTDEDEKDKGDNKSDHKSSTLTRRVLKAWENDDKGSRPESVTVTLLKNGMAYDTVVLSGENDWAHTWENLSSNAQWQLIENDVPGNYTVTVSKEGITFLVVNTYKEPKQEKEPDEPRTTDVLPQTGLFWWPVPLLVVVGILLLIRSRVRSGVRRDNDNAAEKGIIGVAVILSALVLTIINIWEQSAAEKSAAGALAKMEFDTPLRSEDVGEPVIPDYVLNPDMDMPTEQIDGMDYIGKLEIPSLGITLPIADEWNYKSLKKAPCCYFGSIYKNNLVIAGHNYKRHFGGLKSLRAGDDVIFTDVKGNVFYFRVAEREILAADKTEEMTSGEYPLTLFTCTLNGASRVAVRCETQQMN